MNVSLIVYLRISCFLQESDKLFLDDVSQVNSALLLPQCAEELCHTLILTSEVHG